MLTVTRVCVLQGEVCESALPGPLQAVINGADGCILGFGRAGTGE